MLIAIFESKKIVVGYQMNLMIFFFGLGGSWVQPQGPNFPFPWATMLALRRDCSTAALTTPQKVLPIFSDRTRTGISIVTSAADTSLWYYWILFCSWTMLKLSFVINSSNFRCTVFSSPLQLDQLKGLKSLSEKIQQNVGAKYPLSLS